jgi:hypothetical protein
VSVGVGVVAGLVVVVAVAVAVDDDVDVAVDDLVAVGVVAVAVGDELVGGESCVGVGVDRLVAVGLDDFDDDVAAVPDAVPRLVPEAVWPAELPGTEAVAGGPTWLADEPEEPCVPGSFAAGALPLVSNMATMAMTPQVATAIPANRKPRVPERREPRNRSASF